VTLESEQFRMRPDDGMGAPFDHGVARSLDQFRGASAGSMDWQNPIRVSTVLIIQFDIGQVLFTDSDVGHSAPSRLIGLKFRVEDAASLRRGAV
jgi:hypothetical protein